MHQVANRTFSYVNNSQLNNSKTKQTHAFTKSSRFQKVKQSQCFQYAYNLSSSMTMLSKINKHSGGKFSKQSRFKLQDQQLNRKSLSPSPLQYTYSSFTQLNKQKKHGPGFGKSKKLHFQTNQSPGVGKYHAQVYNPETNLSYTMREKTKKDRTHWNKVGPGQYQQKSSFQPNSTYNISKYSKSITTKIGKSRRFTDYDNGVPAPGKYPIQRITTEPSKYINQAVYSFGKGRKINLKHDTPGPGSYTRFSQFSQGSKRILQRIMKM